MTIKLPKDVLGALPAPDSKGTVRVSASLKVKPDGEAELVAINDQPLPSGESDDENPMPADSVPDLGQMEADLYK